MNRMDPKKLPGVFQHNLRAWRLRRNLTLAKLSELLHTSQGTIVNWESGKSSPTLTSVVRISQALRITPEALLTQAEADEVGDSADREILQAAS